MARISPIQKVVPPRGIQELRRGCAVSGELVLEEMVTANTGVVAAGEREHSSGDGGQAGQS